MITRTNDNAIVRKTDLSCDNVNHSSLFTGPGSSPESPDSDSDSDSDSYSDFCYRTCVVSTAKCSLLQLALIDCRVIGSGTSCSSDGRAARSQSSSG